MELRNMRLKSHSNSSVYCSRKSICDGWKSNENNNFWDTQFENNHRIIMTLITYLKNSLEGTALEIRKYQTGFLGLLWVFGGVVFPLASWKISGKAGFSTRFMEQLKEFFPSSTAGSALTSSHLKNGCLSFNFLSCPSVTKCNSFFSHTGSVTFCWPHFLTDHLRALSRFL